MIDSTELYTFKESFRRHMCGIKDCKADCTLNRIHRVNANDYSIEQIIRGCPYFRQKDRLDRIKQMKLVCPELLNEKPRRRRKKFYE